jgi:hypothetical protein
LAEAIDKRLALKFPWGERLNIMTCLEHLLRNADMLLSEAEREKLIAAKKAAEAAEAAAAGDSKRAKKSVAMMSHLQYMQHLCSEGEEDEYSAASILAYFNENPEDVQRNIHVVQSSLKEKSKKVLAILGIPERVGGSSTATPSAAPPAKDVEADFSGMVVRKRKGKSEEPVVSTPVSMGGSTSSLPSSHLSPHPTTTTTTTAQKGGMFKRKQIVEEAPTAAPQQRPQQATPAPVSSGWGDDAGAGWGSSEGFGGGWGDSASVPQPSFTPVVASSPPPPPQPVAPAVNDQQQRLMEVQQQFQALQVRMQTMMMSGNQTPEAMQALMTEQQNLMMTMMSLQK